MRFDQTLGQCGSNHGNDASRVAGGVMTQFAIVISV